MTPLRAVDGNGKGSAQKRSVVGDLRGQMQLVATLFSQRQTDQPARVAGHEVDDLGRDLLGRAHQVAFVLAILVVDDDDHAPFADFGDGVFNGSKWHSRWGLKSGSEIWILNLDL